MRHTAVIIALMTAGESVFLLPFVLARIFRPTLLDVFEITNLELGVAFSTYGVVAIAAYFAGGPLADRYSARSLMSTSLGATGLGGVVLATIPSTGVMNVLWGVWERPPSSCSGQQCSEPPENGEEIKHRGVHTASSMEAEA